MIPVPAPAANSNIIADDQYGQFNAQFHQHIINFEAEAEVQNGTLDAEQARRDELRHNLLAQQQVAQEQRLNIQVRLAQADAHRQQLQVLADQERQHQAMELLHREREAEAERE